MPDTQLPEPIVQGATQLLNSHYRPQLLGWAQQAADAAWVQQATVAGLDAAGLDLLLEDGNGRHETRRIPFPQPVQTADDLRQTLLQLAGQFVPADGARREAAARVVTPKAGRYLKALCNHFDRKASATYDERHGRVQFPFGDCTLEATAEALLLHVAANGAPDFDRVKHVVADHLARFGVNEELVVNWTDETPNPTG